MATAALGDRTKTYELIRMINPLKHGDSAAGISKYKTEPYVIAADVYAVENREGHGRVDLVYRICRMDVSNAHRIFFWIEENRQPVND